MLYCWFVETWYFGRDIISISGKGDGIIMSFCLLCCSSSFVIMIVNWYFQYNLPHITFYVVSEIAAVEFDADSSCLYGDF